MSDYHYNPNYIHHKNSAIGETIRELVFGIEDGMVSTMGAVTGIAVGTGNPFFIILSGVVIIAVESISMGVGSYLSNKSEKEIKERMLEEEREEIDEHPVEEHEEMVRLFVQDGWPLALAEKMADQTGEDKELMLREMAYRELHIIPQGEKTPIRNGLIMWSSYIVGGLVPLMPYFILPVAEAIVYSIGVTLVGLFALGVFTTRYSKRRWWKAGFEMLLLAGAAAAVGYAVGSVADGYMRR